MNTTNFKDSNLPTESDGLNIDVKRVLYNTLRYWYLIVFSVLTGLTIAFLVNRYATKTYSIEASIIIKESEEVSGGELLYNNPLVKFYRNYLNELYIIKSTPLVGATIRELDFDKTFYKIGDLKTSESYKNLPLSIELVQNEDQLPFSFRFELVSEEKFRAHYHNGNEEVSAMHSFGELINQDSITYRLVKLGSIKPLLDDNDVSYQFVYRRISDLAWSYVFRLKVEWAEEGSGVVKLSINGSNTQKELDFLNSLIRNYQQYDLDKKNEAASNAIRFINDQLNDLTDSLNKAERQLEAFKNKTVFTDLNSEALRLYEKMENLELQKTDLILRNRYYDYLTEYIKTNPDLDQAILPSSVGIEDPILTRLVSDMIGMQSEIKMVTHSEKLQNPIVTDKLRRIEGLKTDIIESVKNQKSIDKIKLDFLDKGISDLEGQLSYLPVAERQLVNIRRNYSLFENLYTYLLQKRAEVGISKATNVSDVVMVNPPAVINLMSPNKSRNYVLGFGIGLALPFLIFILIEFSNTRIQSREDIHRYTTIPFIGGVGHKRSNQNIEVFTKSKSAISESFRALRSNLNYFLDGKQKGVFLVTSSISGEGKTFTSINLAAVFTLSGKKTLIIGADMRKPRIYSDFSLDNSIGLSNYLAGLAEFDDVVRTTEFENLDIVSGGPVPPNPSELILTKRMEIFLKEARSRYDFIFIDSPPLALVTDAFVLSSIVDHTLFIVRQNYTPKALLKTIDDFYTAGKISHISIVLNDIYRSGPGYGYGYAYGYGYGYGFGYGYGQRKNGGSYYED